MERRHLYGSVSFGLNRLAEKKLDDFHLRTFNVSIMATLEYEIWFAWQFRCCLHFLEQYLST